MDEPVTRPPTPRWVKVFGVVAVLLILLLVVLLLAGGEHGPDRHAPGRHPAPGSAQEQPGSQP